MTVSFTCHDVETEILHVNLREGHHTTCVSFSCQFIYNTNIDPVTDNVFKKFGLIFSTKFLSQSEAVTCCKFAKNND